MIKIFEVNGEEWVAAETLEQACSYWKTATGMGDEDLDNPRELTDSEMDEYKHLGEDGVRSSWPKEKIPTFRQELAQRKGRTPAMAIALALEATGQELARVERLRRRDEGGA